MSSLAAPPARPVTYDRFSIGSTLDGWEVTDADGRSVSPSYERVQIASQVRATLNNAAANGPRNLARALGAIEDE